MEKLTTGLLKFVRMVFVWILLGASSFILKSCNSSGNDTQSKDTSTTTMITPDSAVNMADTLNPAIDTGSGKDVKDGKDKKP